MCGIAGKLDFDAPVDEATIHRMCQAMHHRGPDSRGVFAEDGVSLGIQRLAIIDVVGGDQPIFNEDETVVVVLNGEIYNFPSLREELSERGHRFRTHSDTEVLVHLYEELGERMVERLHGMFAFAIWDRTRKLLFLARDRVGKKPLFWARRGNTIWFASEIRALLEDPALDRTPDSHAIASYLAFQYVPHPQSAFQGVRKLPPATAMTVTADGESQTQYWSLDYGEKIEGRSEEDLQEELRTLLWNATRIRLMSEVPLGAFLSGGIDSSAVVAAMSDQVSEPVKTFSIGFPDAAFDEVQFARMVAERFATDHHEFRVEPSAIDIMPKLARHYGEPFADPSAIPSFYLAELTSNHVTVALNGDGGDESFAGYTRYLANDRSNHLNWMPRPLRALAPVAARPFARPGTVGATVSRVHQFTEILAMDPSGRYTHRMSAFQGMFRGAYFQPEFLAALGDWDIDAVIERPWRESTARGRIDRMMDVDVRTYLPDDLLVKMDIATMAYSVEARSPFLDHRLMEFAASLPVELKLDGTNGKRLLKSAMRGIVPDGILDREKMGFGVPLERWFREDLRELPRQLLLDPSSSVLTYLKPAAIDEMIRQHQDGVADHSLRIWVLLQLENWHREVVTAS